MNEKLGLYLREAVLKNTCPPNKTEEKRLTVSKQLRTSVSREGDSELGLILYCGIANQYGMSVDDISLSVSIDPKEVNYKIGRFATMSGQRFASKVALIKNYLKLKYGIIRR